MIAGIYKLTSPSGKSYIGQSVNVNVRVRMYRGLHCKSQPSIYNALKKYGFDNFSSEVLWSTNRQHMYTNLQLLLDILEKKYIEKYDCIDNGYNIMIGGDSYGNHSSESKRRIAEAKKIKVNQYDLNGKYIKTWGSAKEACDKLHLNRGHVSQVCSGGRKSSGGYMWRFFVNTKDIKPVHRRDSSRSVVQYSLDGKFIKKWGSATEAAKGVGVTRSSISLACIGTYKSSAGFKWTYDE